MLKKPSITIITPVFNSERFISSCIENVIAQNCKDLEHLIIDGGSTDQTVQIVQSYASIHSHVRIISEKDNGQSDAMNKGIRAAKADLISFLNADDLYAPFILNRVLMLFTQNTKLDFAVGNCRVIDQEGSTIFINRPKRLMDYHFYSYKEPFPINPAAYFYKKSIHDDVGYYNTDNHYNMDYEFLLKAVRKYQLVYFEEDWGIMLHHEDAKTANDMESGRMESRKKEVFQKEYSKLTLSQKVKVFSYKLKPF